MNLDYAENIIKAKIEQDIYEIAEKFFNSGYKLYLVGGIIRDNLLNIDISGKESDLATDATPEEIKRIFRKGVIPTGIKHGTVTLIYKDKNYEITTFRIEGKYSDGRRPDEVKYAKTIYEDLSRRDFTINALAFDLKSKKLIDNFNGLADLENKIIRTIGDPDKRFREDGLRLIRAIRFATTLGFTIEEKTFKSIVKNIDMIKSVSFERIRDEFVKILGAEKPSIGIELLRKTEILRLIIPELLLGFGVVQNKFHKYSIYYHNIYSCDYAPKDNLVVRLAALFHDIAKPHTKKIPEDRENDEATFYNHEVLGTILAKRILKRLKFSNEIIEKVLNLIRNHMFYYTEEWTDSAVRRFIRKVGLDNIEDIFKLREADRLASGIRSENSYHLELLKKHINKILEEENAFSIRDLKVNGYDVMEIKKIPPSPLVGKILNYLFEIVLNDPSKNERETLLKLIKEYKIQE
jgi:poly(A) polymerase/tRNA nucleotidyltransferase (CCA-adding enzyme)